MRRHKFNAHRVELDGIKFASGAEASRYQILKLMEKAGKIAGLTLQPKFVLVPACVVRGQKQRAICYQADFQYTENGLTVVEDVKGWPTRESILKMKMFRFQHQDVELRITR